MTRNKAAKSEARERAAVTGKYTAARRETRHDREPLTATSATSEALEPARQHDHHHTGAKPFDRVDAAFSQLIGMQNVKNAVADHVRMMQACEELKKRNLPVPARFSNMAFVGPSGTGKSTVARIVAELRGCSNVVEVSRRDLVGVIPGSSADQAKEAVASALGGVLIIDNAHDLMSDDQDRRGREMINALVSELDAHHDDLVVILVGSEPGMMDLFGWCKALSARFVTKIQFDPYSPEELAEIAELAAEQRGQILAPEAKQAIIDIREIQHASAWVDHAGNARFAYDIINNAEVRKIRRIALSDIASMSDEALRTLTESDVIETIPALAPNLAGVRFNRSPAAQRSQGEE